MSPGGPAGFLIRELREREIPALSDFGKRVFRQTFQEDPDHTEENMAMFLAEVYSHAALRAEFLDPHLTFVVATAPDERDGEAIVGYAKIRREKAPPCVVGDAPLELGQLYVDFDWHGRGVAHALMERCVELAKSEGFRTMWLGVWHRNIRAQKFYRKWGFEWCGQYPFQFGNMNQKDEVLVRRL